MESISQHNSYTKSFQLPLFCTSSHHYQQSTTSNQQPAAKKLTMEREDSLFDVHISGGGIEEMEEADGVTSAPIAIATEAALKDRHIAEVKDKLNLMMTLLTKKEAIKGMMEEEEPTSMPEIIG
jgi:hypothetical protein